MVRILLVDDEALVRSVLRAGLEAKGHEVVDAADGRRALDMYRQSHFDLVITDVLMPDMDGIELVRQLRQEREECRLLAISGGASFGCEYLASMKTFGASATLAKPFSIDELSQVVDQVMAV